MGKQRMRKINLTIWLMMAVFVGFVSCPAAVGRIIYVDDDAPGVDDGSSWLDAYNYLHDALSAAAAGDVIRVAQGVYTPDSNAADPNGSGDCTATFQLKNGVTIEGGYAGLGEADPNARDIEGYESILSGDLYGDDGPDFANDEENSYHVVTGSGSDSSAVLAGFTITGGNARSHPNYSGGGMYNSSGSPTVANCTVIRNTAEYRGGGMCNCDSSAPTITQCLFSENLASNGGGGMYNCGGSPKLTDCTFSRNSAGCGGGMYNEGSCQPMILRCTFTANLANYGGGMFEYDGYSRAMLEECTFSENSASGGGGMYLKSNATISNCVFVNNSAGKGGALYARDYKCIPTVTNCRFAANSAQRGGGIYSYHCTSQEPICTFINCTVMGNTVVGEGGGMYNNSSVVRLVNCTFSGNIADGTGGGVENWREHPVPTGITISSNCLLWNNRDNSGVGELAQFRPSDSTPTLNYCCVQGWTGSLGGTGNFGSNPLLISDGYHLTDGSPCIDAGDPNGDYSGQTDIDGQPRISNGRVDIGADESHPETPIIGVSPANFDFFCPEGGPDPQPQILSVWNNLTGTLRWQISEDCNWMDASPASGQSSGQITEVAIAIDANRLARGEYTYELEVSDSNAFNSPEYVTVNLNVRPTVIGIAPNELNFTRPLRGPNPEPQILSVWNDDIGILRWQVTEDCNWLNALPTSGESSGEIDEVLISIDANDLCSGEYSCVVTVFDPNAINSPQEMTVNLEVRPPIIGVAPSRFDVVGRVGGPNPESQILSIWNDDVGLLKWEVSEDCNWLSVEPNSGSSTGEVDEVTLEVDISGLALGTYNCTVTISDLEALNSPQVVPVTLTVSDETVYVPDDFSNIQAAIDHTLERGTVIVADGTYSGPGNYNIDFRGKAITVRSENGPEDCFIDCNGLGRGFHFHNDEDERSVVNGFTITNGYAPYGGGIWCYWSSPVVTNCTVIGNRAHSYPGGGGIASNYSNLVIKDCTITNNSAERSGGAIRNGHGSIRILNCVVTGNTVGGDGGGIYNSHTNLKIANSIIVGNTAGMRGGGIHNWGGSPTIANCTISANVAGNAGGAICNTYGADPVLVNNCILWGNGAPVGSEIALFADGYVASQASVSYCDVQGGQSVVHITDTCTLYWGDGNIDDDPMFVREPNDGGDGWGVGDNDDFGDLHLRFGSPCINAGHPYFYAEPNSVDIDGEPRVWDGRIDIGADEFIVPLVGVIKPEGGEVWAAGSEHEVRWYSWVYEGAVDALLSEDGGSNWQTIANDIANTGSCKLTLPEAVDSNQCLIWVVPSVPDGNVTCLESGLFTIKPYRPGIEVESKWKSLGGDFKRTGLSEDNGPELGCLKWRFATGGPVSASVTIGAYERVHIPCEDGRLYTLDANGLLLWSYDVNSPLLSSASVGDDGTVYVGSENGKLYAIDVNGNLRWTHTTDGPVYSSPAVSADGESIYVGSEDGWLYTLGRDGSEFWSFETGGPAELGGALFASPAIGPDGTVYVAGLYDPNLYALEPNDGSVKWICRLEKAPPGRASNPYPTDGATEVSRALDLRWTAGLGATSHDVYIGWSEPPPYRCNQEGTIFQGGTLAPGITYYWRIDERNDWGVTEGVVWSFTTSTSPPEQAASGEFAMSGMDANDAEAGMPFASPVVGPDGTIYQTLLYDSYLYAIEPNAGTIIWLTDLTDPCSGWFDAEYAEESRDADAWSEPVLGPDGTIYVSFDDPYLRAVDANGSIKWVSRLGLVGGLTLTVGSDGLIYAAGDGGYLYVVNADGLEVARFRGDGRLSFPVVAADNTVIVSDANDTVWAITQEDCEGQPGRLNRVADLDGDGTVGWYDLAVIVNDWLRCTVYSDCGYVGSATYLPGDISLDFHVDFEDVAVLANRWLNEE